MKKILLALALAASILLCGCSSEADKANYNISKQADYFESERKITVYNARTDKVIMEAEGYMSISNITMAVVPCLFHTLSLKSIFYSPSTAIYSDHFWTGLRNHTATGRVIASAAGTASHMPVRPNFIGRTIRNKSNSANERRNVIRPEQYPFPYAIIRTAAKILIPENRKPSP